MGRPRVILKLATSLDGRLATASGESRWITGEAARAEVQRMRAAANAILIGAGTLRADDPQLIARTDPPPPRQPLRVVLDTLFSSPPCGRLFDSLDQAPLLFIGASEGEGDRRASLGRAGARTAVVAADHRGVDVGAALSLLLDEDIGTVLVEGGGLLAASLISADAVERIEWFRAPIALGAAGRPAIGPLDVPRLADAPRFRRVALRELGPDIWESYERVS
jgi:diaminohydroxyphosphoribosylaminopyrimidine deaminase/5-amino-6-(5-phosphoribosylamino)uracil reductase